MQVPEPIPPGAAQPNPFVERGALFRGAALAIHDNVCRRDDARVSAETRPLEYDEIVFPRSGAWLRHRGREQLLVDPCRAHLFARGESHRVSHPGTCGDRNTGIVLSPAALAEIDPRVGERGAFATPSVAVDEGVYAEHCALVDGLRRGVLDALEVEERALRLAVHVIVTARGAAPASAAGASRPAHRDLAHAARALLATRFAEPIDLGDVATALGVSVHHLCRVFRAEFGTTLHRERRSLRVRAALRLLCNPSLSLYDVAALTGFSDRTQLNRAFHKVLRRPPSAFRREHGTVRPIKNRHAGLGGAT
ncbi:MAG: helix-turn-helix transcriptional regulator [Planctomycetota bacterium]